MSGGGSRSRGRGWIQDDKDSSSKPGRPLHTKNVDYNTNLVNIVNNITNENLEQQIQEFLKLIDSNFEETYDKLHERARNNKEFGQKFVRLIRLARTSQPLDCVESQSLFRYLMNTVQKNYEERTEIRQKNIVQFYNDIYLLSELVFYFTSATYTMQLVSSALLDYMEMLLETATIEEISMFTEQIFVHGKYICATCKNKMDILMIIARQVLIKNDLPPASRQMLLYTIDLVNQNFKPLPANLQEFYELQLGKNFIHVTNNDDNTQRNKLHEVKDQSVSLSSSNIRTK